MTRTGDLRFYMGTWGAVLPLGVFLLGVAWLGFSGAPDERGFWPVLVAALTAGTILARDRSRYIDAVLLGMSRPIVMLMISAWLLAGILGSLMTASGLVDALIGQARFMGVTHGVFVAASFVVCCVVSTSTGTSLGTILICAPPLFQAGVLLGGHPGVLIGAILGGATFGDNVSPVSDTTIASAATQGAELGGVVRSRMRYAVPAALVALMGCLALGGRGVATGMRSVDDSNVLALLMLLVPILVIGMLLAKRHLIEGLLAGCVLGLLLSLVVGLITPGEVIAVDSADFIARGIILSGMERGVGVSIFTLLLMGLIGGIEASGVVDRTLGWVQGHMQSRRSAEFGIFGAVTAATFLTTHSTVALLAVGRLARDAGTAFGLNAYRRANILDVTVCTYPFLLPFFVPTILASSMTAGGPVPRVSAFQAGAFNLYSWALLGVLIVAIVTGWGRGKFEMDQSLITTAPRSAPSES